MSRKKFNPRTLVQVVFALVVLSLGINFILFVNHYLGPNANSPFNRPAGVEGFLPISALVALKAWLATGIFDTIHPAGLVILLTAIIISVIFKKAFCGWLCPIGTLSTGLARIGKFLFGRNFRVPLVLDYPLRSLKYLIMAFFLSTVLLGMSGSAAAAFLNTPYNMVADVKMLQFFQNLAGVGLLILGLIIVLSVLFENFWCRYLCPYGALLGIISMVSPWRIARTAKTCINCSACTQACPNRIEVATAQQVWSPECNGCLECVRACPVPQTLQFRSILTHWAFSPQAMALAVVGTWLIFVAVAKLSGHWQTSITPQMYRVLIPNAANYTH
ncbi:MAG: 4Fe-4S binding protein [Peptococcaceae bacterium]|nr:4Fe-4S binding protein [Peptococcaceae bacterium]